MIKRLILLVTIILVGGYISQNVDLSGSKDKFKNFIEENTGEEIFKDMSLEGLTERKEKLEGKLNTLAESLKDKVEEGSDKYYEIEQSVMDIKQAIEDTQEAIEKLQESVEKTKESLGVGRVAE